MEWLANNGNLLWWLTGLSLGSVVMVILAVPWVVSRLPRDYFSRDHRESWSELGDEPWYALVLGLLKNLLGAALVILGVVLLFTPGQGLITLLAGLLLMNFPGKYRLERALVARPKVFNALNWLRKRHDVEPFEPP